MSQATPVPEVLRVGLFGGAFDPPHRTHVALAQAALQQLALDVLHVVPTGTAWHKQQNLSPAEQRLAMVEMTFASMPGVQVDTCELQRSGPTYTIETLQQLQAHYPRAQLYLIIGEDQARALPAWHRIEEVVHAAIICVAQRADSGAAGTDAGAFAQTMPALRYLQMPASKLSATEIRAAVAKAQDVSHLVFEPVARYIEQHHLYKADR